ncbi:FRG domain-containing protein [Butyrivibrio proteoclasticus B316]|uniref:FRG domain-containing protein n=2 Tax=Butyrivibrio proteoclasticus TaxID=43305 RepID=E0RXS5_BUTPB|nr:FRG domain-containing protein [Butyrivibrio proteoclasticus B316]
MLERKCMKKVVEDFDEKTPSKADHWVQNLKCGDSVNVYHIETVNDLNQFIGYAKRINNKYGDVYFRGQTSLYNGKMIPSLYRGQERLDSITEKYNRRINKVVKSKGFKGYDRAIFEPLIQHYGIKTPYIDLVDNVWVALWFALHEAQTKIINSHEYVYYYDSKAKFSYIVLMLSDATKGKEEKPGVYVGEKTTLIDLRKSTSSVFLRPHAQHAYMIKKNEECPGDYSDLIVGIAQIPTSKGLSWLGCNEFLSLKSLFPACHFDSGYEHFLRYYPEENRGTVKAYGSIQILTD